MTVSIKSDKIVLPGSIFDGYILITDGKITDICKDKKTADKEYDFTGKYVTPGFIDLHVHGGGGFDFAASDTDGIVKAAEFHLSHGTTTIYPTIASSEFNKTLDSLKRIDAAKDKLPSNFGGVHLEGPYFAPQMCGAQNPELITPPKKEEYEVIIDKYSDIIKRWSFAPERDQDGEFCKALVSAGITASAGHTAATFDDMSKAFDCGLNSVTHLYSCTSSVTRNMGFRKGGVIEYAFYQDGIIAELIADGAHLPRELINLVFKIKGRDGITLITDSMSVAGIDQKSGNLNGIDYIVEDDVCKLRDRSAFAGSIATTDRLVKTCVQFGISVVDSVYMVTGSPAKAMGLCNKGALQKGFDADIVVLDSDFNTQTVFVNGEKI